MKTEQTIDLNELKKLLPSHAQIEFQRKKGQTGKASLEISVTIKPSITEKKHDEVVEKIIAFFGDDLIEAYTEDTGRSFYVYLRLSATQPTTVIL